MNLLYEYARMCNSSNCGVCQIYGDDGCLNLMVTNPDEAERRIREWAEAHPEQTYKSYFLKRFPNARLNEDTGLPIACVRNVFGKEHALMCIDMSCADCWNRPYKEDM